MNQNLLSRSNDVGCDIHCHVEVKVGGKWHHYTAPQTPRNYDLFSLMAGVRSRGDLDPIAQQRGLPANISSVTAISFRKWQGNAHSMSWLSSQEMSQLVDAAVACGAFRNEWDSSNYFGYIFGNTIKGWTQYPEDRVEEVEDFRVVFWFDN